MFLIVYLSLVLPALLNTGGLVETRRIPVEDEGPQIHSGVPLDRALDPRVPLDRALDPGTPLGQNEENPNIQPEVLGRITWPEDAFVSFNDCLESLNDIDVDEFSKKSAELSNSHAAKLRNVRDSYGAGKCDTFAIFQGLAFLYAAATMSVNVMNTINSNNNNNNNNNNLNENMNMNMNMNTNRKRRESSPVSPAGFENTLLRSYESLPSISGLFQLPAENLSENFAAMKKNFAKELDNLHLPGLSTVRELWQKTEDKEPITTTTTTTTTKSERQPTITERPASKKTFADLLQVPDLFPKNREDFSSLLPSTFRFSETKFPSLADLFSGSLVRSSDLVPAPDVTSFLQKSFTGLKDFEAGLKSIIQNSGDKGKVLQSLRAQIDTKIKSGSVETSPLDPLDAPENRIDRDEQDFRNRQDKKIQLNKLNLLTRDKNSTSSKENRDTVSASTKENRENVSVSTMANQDKNAPSTNSNREKTGASTKVNRDNVAASNKVKRNKIAASTKTNRNISPTSSKVVKNKSAASTKENITSNSTIAGPNRNNNSTFQKVESGFSLPSLVNSNLQAMWNNSFINIPLIKEISEDISSVSELLKNSSLQSASDNQTFNQKLRSNLENLHFTNHVKNASEEIKKFKLPGLPSIGDLWTNSLNISSKLQNLTALVSPSSVLSYLGTDYGDYAEQEMEDEVLEKIDETIEEDVETLRLMENTLDTSSDEPEIKKSRDEADQSLEEYLVDGIKTLLDDSFVRLRYTLDEATKVFVADETNNATFDPRSAMKNLSISLLQGLESLPVPSSFTGLINPQVDVDNLEQILKILPHMFPYIMQDYKDRLTGLMVGTRITQEQLFEIHSSLVDWHNKIDSVRAELPGGGIYRVLGILQEHNLALLSLLMNLMVLAGEDGDVSLTHHHLNVIDRHLLKAEDLFPGLKGIL